MNNARNLYRRRINSYVGGGVDITADSSNRLYLVGSKDLVGSNVETLNTYNATTYFQSGNLYMAGNKVITAADTTKLVGNYSRVQMDI